MQGPRSAAEVIEAVEKLDADPSVDVIVVARGGGSVEDLLPFSDEALLRAVHKARTPVVSAIGHEQDAPLLDLAADVRASTPTDAAKLVVPDMAEELAGVIWARDRVRAVTARIVDREQERLDQLRSRPVMADPRTLLVARSEEVDRLLERARRTLGHRLDRAADDIGHQRARARALSPLATLRRGYAVLQDADGHVVTSAGSVAVGAQVSIRVADGRVLATATSSETDPAGATGSQTDPAGATGSQTDPAEAPAGTTTDDLGDSPAPDGGGDARALDLPTEGSRDE
jgi:exodeoxyribonuclease VII large subunit